MIVSYVDIYSLAIYLKTNNTKFIIMTIIIIITIYHYYSLAIYLKTNNTKFIIMTNCDNYDNCHNYEFSIICF
jgi:hypothetical protein